MGQKNKQDAELWIIVRKVCNKQKVIISCGPLAPAVSNKEKLEEVYRWVAQKALDWQLSAFSDWSKNETFCFILIKKVPLLEMHCVGPVSCVKPENIFSLSNFEYKSVPVNVFHRI